MVPEAGVEPANRLDVNELLFRAELLGRGAEGPNRTAAAQGFNLPLYS